jgi:hypothetical protein
MLIVVAAAAPVLAQQPRPKRTGPEIASASLGVSTSTSGNMVTGDVIDDAFASQNPAAVSRYVTDLRGGVRYSPFRGRVSLNINANSAVRRYQTEDRFAILGHSVGASTGVVLGQRTQVSASGSWSYVPSYSLNPGFGAALPGAGSLDPQALAAAADPQAFAAAGSNAASMDPAALRGAAAGLIPDAAADFAIGKNPVSAYSGGVHLSHNLSRRLSFNVGTSISMQVAQDERQPEQHQTSMSGGLRLSLTRHASLRLGYQRRITQANLPTGLRQREIDDIDAGIDYTRSFQLSLTKSTTFSFGTGSAITSDDDRRNAHVTGSATLSQAFGKRGKMTLNYSRAVGVQEGIWEPVMSNTIALQGMVSIASRLAFQANAAATSADSAVSVRQGIDSRVYYRYSGSAQLGYKVSSRGNAFAQYQLYSHSIGSNVEMLDGIPRDAFQHSVRVGVTWSLPLLTGRLERN